MVAAMGEWHEDSHGSHSPVPPLRRRGVPLGARIWEFPARKEIRRTVRKNFSLCAGTQRQQDSVPGAGRGPNDSHVHPGAFLEPDPQLSHARYIAINNKYDFLPKQLEDKGMTIVADIAQVLRDARDTMDSGDNDR